VNLDFKARDRPIEKDADLTFAAAAGKFLMRRVSRREI